jgi:hypothetical protein
LPKKLFNSTQKAFGSNIAQATGGATATVINVTIDADTSPEAAAHIIRQIEAATGVDRLPAPAFSLNDELIVVGPPVAPDPRIRREALATAIEQALAKSRPVLLRGEQRSGRSELARATVETAMPLLWLDFSANSQLPAGSVLNSAISSQMVPKRGKAAKNFERLVDQMAEGLVLVLDNIDAPMNDPSFAQRLGILARAASAAKFVLICTCIHPLTATLEAQFEVIPVPRYNDSDVEETLQVYGAPASIRRPQFQGYVRGLTQGEPELTNLLVQFLARNNWKLNDDEVWAGMLQQTFAEPLKGETQRRLLQTEVEPARTLLYRLTSLMRPFTEKQALQIARVEPEIPQAAERLATLYGRWLQNAGGKEWRTSPLLSGLGDANLTRPVKKQVHKTVVDWIVALRTLNQLNTGEAITHLLLAEEFDEAGGMLLRALYSLLNAGPDAEPGHLLSFWKGLPLPEEMSLSIRIGIRGIQIALAIQRGLEYQSQLEDFRDLISAARGERELVSSFASLSMIALRLVSERPIEALPFITQSANQQTKIADHSVVEAFDGHSSAEMFWAAAMQIKGRDGVRQWVVEIDKLAPQVITSLMEAPFAVESATKMLDALWMREQDLPEETRDWHGLLAYIEELEQITSRWNSSLIAACLLRARQAIRIVHLAAVEDALKDGNAFLSAHAAPNDAAARFLVAHGTALWLTDLDRWSEALSWLEAASEYRVHHLALHRQQNLLRYGHALYRAGRPDAAPFREATQSAEADDTLTPFNEIRARAEYATFLWLTGRKSDHFREWSLVGQRTLAIRDDSQRWKQLFVLVANHTSFWGNRMAQVVPPDGNMVAKPELGMFITDYADLSDRYSDKVLFVMPGNMTWFAERVGETKEAADWAKVAVETATQFTEPRLGKGFLLQAVPYAVETAHYRDAVDYAAEAIRGLGAQDTIEIPEATLRDNPSLKHSRLVTVFPPAQTEANVITVGLLPSLLGVIGESFRDRANALLQVDDLLGACLSQRDGSDAPEAWEVACRVLESIRDGSLRYRDFLPIKTAPSDWPAQTADLLKSFALMMLNNDEAVDMLRAQIRWANWLTQSFAPFRGIGRMLTSLIVSAWAGYIGRNSFRFWQPSHLVNSIQSCAVKGELGRVFVEITESLGVSIPHEFREQLLGAVFGTD